MDVNTPSELVVGFHCVARPCGCVKYEYRVYSSGFSWNKVQALVIIPMLGYINWGICEHNNRYELLAYYPEP
jgi:hypothetical protein